MTDKNVLAKQYVKSGSFSKECLKDDVFMAVFIRGDADNDEGLANRIFEIGLEALVGTIKEEVS